MSLNAKRGANVIPSYDVTISLYLYSYDGLLFSELSKRKLIAFFRILQKVANTRRKQHVDTLQTTV